MERNNPLLLQQHVVVKRKAYVIDEGGRTITSEEIDEISQKAADKVMDFQADGMVYPTDRVELVEEFKIPWGWQQKNL